MFMMILEKVVLVIVAIVIFVFFALYGLCLAALWKFIKEEC